MGRHLGAGGGWGGGWKWPSPGKCIQGAVDLNTPDAHFIYIYIYISLGGGGGVLVGVVAGVRWVRFGCFQDVQRVVYGGSKKEVEGDGIIPMGTMVKTTRPLH